MNWNDYTLNPKVILGYYTEAPSLTNVEIHRLTLLRDAAMVEMVLEPTQFPDKHSKRWPVGSNACQITLRAMDVTQLEMRGWATTIIGNLSIEPDDGGFVIGFEGVVSLKIRCPFIDVSRVTGY